MSVYHSLKRANSIRSEIERMRDFGNIWPRDLSDATKIFVPQLTIDKVHTENKPLAYDEVLRLPLKDVDVYDWLSLFKLNPTDEVAVLLSRVIDELQRLREPYGFENIYGMIDVTDADTKTKSALKSLFYMIEKLNIFDSIGVPYNEIVKGGQISVLDLSYLGRISGYDVRNLIVALIGRRLLSERTLYTTLEMQAEAGLIDLDITKDIAKEYPLVYMMIDEAHLFLPAHEKTLATDILIDWIKLGRHPGLSLVFATQEPSALHESAIRQCDLMIAHNITSEDDVAALGRAKQTFMRGGADIQKIVSTMEFKRGLAVVFDDKTRKVVMCRVRPRLTLHTGVDASAIPLTELQRVTPSIPTTRPLTPKPKGKETVSAPPVLRVKRNHRRR
jgi:hypothetical protein